ncbi:hypothetical protein L226DRAFT_529106 [Lentinus tigrinus ALCF2SS1-7]|uniref:F-box domain-containing protein n=1 Tax=Lentinus tigrinus ALCF2SS1-6 TaxID=1328759 RepID=A0A5C2SUB3_9APHY|nr:hypothetical protein L227DRAFT_558877 [Lentinus tigrinus ALCF2SS1-6]RPD80639.1 hypothetical protein L226DRAFT_529106 [Lentinus tigrinus ALCF2SS1-7]
MIATQSNDAITFHVEEILRLKRLFNSSSRIARLPTHILSRIFLAHATTFYQRRLAYFNGVRGEHIGDSTHKDLYSWTTVAHVCRYWREVALGCAQLWTTIVLDERVSPQFTKLLLERSRGLPLNVVLHSIAGRYHCSNCRAHVAGTDNYFDAIEMLPDMLPNARRLSVFIEREDHVEIWGALQNLCHATKLESLHFGGVGGASSFYRGEATVEVPKRLTSQLPPLLSSLEIWGVKILWENPLYCTSLRRLKISHYLSNPGAHLGHLLAALSNMSNLEILIIDEIPPARRNEDYRRVSLPRLRHLQVSLCRWQWTRLLSSLDFPSSTSVLFSGSPQYGSGPNKNAISENIQRAVVRSIAALLRDTAIYTISYVEEDDPNRYPPQPCLRIWTIQRADSQSYSASSWPSIEATPPRIEMNARLDGPIIMRTLAALDLRSVHMVKIDAHSTRHSRLFIESFRSATNLACLYLRGEVAFPLGAVLAGWSRPAHLDEEERKRVEEYMTRVAAKEADSRTDCSWDALPPSWYGFGEVDEMAYSDVQTDEGNNRHLAHLPREGSPVPCGGPYPLFPHLGTLVVEAIDFPLPSRCEGRHRFIAHEFRLYNDFLKIQYGFPAKGLARGLQLRLEAGVSEVVRVEFKDCQCLEMEQLISLVDVVPIVVWDGKRLTMEDVRKKGDPRCHTDK